MKRLIVDADGTPADREPLCGRWYRNSRGQRGRYEADGRFYAAAEFGARAVRLAEDGEPLFEEAEDTARAQERKESRYVGEDGC